jgi:hypothetical protein
VSEQYETFEVSNACMFELTVPITFNHNESVGLISVNSNHCRQRICMTELSHDAKGAACRANAMTTE